MKPARAAAKQAILFAATGLLALAALASPTSAATQLVSARNPLIPRPAGGNGDSVAPSLTPDGNCVLFISTANDLTLGGNNLLHSDLYVWNRALNSNTLVSASLTGFGGGNANSYGGMISTNGRYVVFASDASDLVSGDTNNATDVFLRDLQAGTTTLISVATNGGPGNGSSTSPFMTPDGRFVAFVSTASNLAPNNTNGVPGVFVRDTQAGTTTLATPGTAGPSLYGLAVMGSPVLTPDGRYVAFFSTASNLPSNGFGNTNGEIYLCDLTTTNITWLSSNASSIAGFAGGASAHPVMSDDGRYIAFKYGSTNGPNVGTNNQGASWIFQYDALALTTTVICSNAFPPVPGSDDVYGPEMTPDGRYVVSVEQTVVSNVPYSSVHLWDRLGPPDTLVSQNWFGGFPTNTMSDTPVITPDGSKVAFMSSATTLVTNSVASGWHVYLRNLVTGQTQLVDVDTNGAGSVDVLGTAPSLSTNGQCVGFSSPDGSLVSGDFNHARDVFLRDTVNGTNEMVSVRNPLVYDPSGDGISTFFFPTINPTGRFVVYASRADDLVTNDFNGSQDVFEADLWTGSNTLVSVGLDGNSALGGDSYDPMVSADGRYVVFLSAATNLVATNLPNATNYFYNLYRRDVQTGTTVLVNVDSNGLVLNQGDCSLPFMSQDGRFIVFLQSIPAPSFTNLTILRDVTGGRTTVLSAAMIATSGRATVRADGRYVGYYDNYSNYFHAWDTLKSSNVYSSGLPGNGLPVSLSPTGTRILLPDYFAAVDFISNSILFSLRPFPVTTTTIDQLTDWSTDARFFVFQTTSVLSSPASLDTNSANDVFLADLQASNMTVVSTSALQAGTANAASDSPSLSGDGRFVVFRSFATDIAPGLTTSPNVILYDRYFNTNNLVTTQSRAEDWNAMVAKPAISGNGGMVAFHTPRASLAAGTAVLNHEINVYAATVPIWGTADTVGDGIPDEWRAYYFGGNGTTTNSQSCATCDADGSGMSNLQDYLAGINPTNAGSVLAVGESSVVSGNSALLQWTATPGINYAVQYTDSLSNPDWVTATGDIVIVGFQASFTAPATSATRYYRVVVVN